MVRHSAAPPLLARPLRALPAIGLWTGGFILTYGAGIAVLGGLGAPGPWIPVGAGMIAALVFQAMGRRGARLKLPSALHLKADERLGRALEGTQDADQVASIVLGALRKALKPRHAYLWLLDADRPEFTLAAGLGLPPDVETLPAARVQAWVAAQGPTGMLTLSPEEAAMAAEFGRWLVRHDLSWVEPVMSLGRQVGLLTLATRGEAKAYGPGDLWLVARALREGGQALALIEHNRAEKARRSRLDNLTQRYKDAQQRAITDGLTGLATHAYFKEQLGQRFAEARRHAQPISVLLLDIDHFKRINDTWGHPVGDDVLKLVSRAVKGVSRTCDTVARYGGEEMALVLPCTDLEGASALGERIREAIAAIEPVDGRGRPIPPITASVGVAEYEVRDGGPEDMIARADAALYLAKREGRNQVRRAG